VEATDLIPMLEGHQPSNEFHSRILFKHEKFIGEEEAFSIGGFQDLKTPVKLKNGMSYRYAHQSKVFWLPMECLVHNCSKKLNLAYQEL
jgi:hypothetical protein